MPLVLCQGERHWPPIRPPCRTKARLGSAWKARMVKNMGDETRNYGKSQFLMGKLTISMAIFNSKLLNYQMVYMWIEIYRSIHVNIEMRMYYLFIYIYIRSTPRPVTADKWVSFNLPFQNEHKEIAPKISARRRCPKKSQPALQTSDTEFRIQDRGFTFKIFQAYQLHSNIEKRRAQTTDNTFMCYPEKVRARRLHRSKD